MNTRCHRLKRDKGGCSCSCCLATAVRHDRAALAPLVVLCLDIYLDDRLPMWASNGAMTLCNSASLLGEKTRSPRVSHHQLDAAPCVNGDDDNDDVSASRPLVDWNCCLSAWTKLSTAASLRKAREPLTALPLTKPPPMSCPKKTVSCSQKGNDEDESVISPPAWQRDRPRGKQSQWMQTYIDAHIDLWTSTLSIWPSSSLTFRRYSLLARSVPAVGDERRGFLVHKLPHQRLDHLPGPVIGSRR